MTVNGSNAESAGIEAAQRKLEEIQLARLTHRLRHLHGERDVAVALGEDPKKFTAELSAQYQALSTKLRDPVTIQPPALSSRLTANLDKLGDIFGFWQTIALPLATVGVVQKPTSPKTGGTGIGATIFPSNLALGGDLFNSGSQEQWWVSTWNHALQFPQTSPNGPPGSLSYRFNAGASLGFYRQDVISGSLHVYVTVATTGDIANHPINFSNFASSTFLIDAGLPLSAVPAIIGGSATVRGSIPLVAGRTPAIGIALGVITSISNGNLQVVPGEFSNLEIAPPNATTPGDLGKIQFRHDPVFWVEAVQQRLG